MNCTQCGYNNESGTFCAGCGAKLQQSATSDNGYSRAIPSPLPPVLPRQEEPSWLEEPPVSVPAEPFAETNNNGPQLKQAEQAGNSYVAFALQVLKNPVRASESANAGYMPLGIATMFVFSFMYPLMVYFALRRAFGAVGDLLGMFGPSVSFGQTVVKPLFVLFVVVLLVNTLIFAVLRIGNSSVSYRVVTARFGAFMIPATAVLAAAFLFSVLGIDASLLAYLGMFGLLAWFAAICFALYSFKKEHPAGLDALYGTLITFAGTALLLKLFGESLLKIFFGGVGSPF